MTAPPGEDRTLVPLGSVSVTSTIALHACGAAVCAKQAVARASIRSAETNDVLIAGISDFERHQLRIGRSLPGSGSNARSPRSAGNRRCAVGVEGLDRLQPPGLALLALLLGPDDRLPVGCEDET